MIEDFPIHCNVCGDEIQDGFIFFKHPALGFVCEHCPEFGAGIVRVKEESTPCRPRGTKSIFGPYKIPRRNEK